MANTIEIVFLDLDTEKAKRSLDNFESSAIISSKKIGDSLDSNISDPLDKIINKISGIASGFAASIPVLIFLEKKFGVISSVLGKLGLDKFVNDIERLTDSIYKFFNSDLSFDRLRFEVSLFLQSIGLIDSSLLKLASNALTTSRAIEQIAPAALTVAGAGVGLGLVVKNFNDIVTTSGRLLDVFFKGGGIFNVVSGLSGLATVFKTVSIAIEDSESSFLRFSSVALNVAAILTGGLAAGISFIIIKFGELANVIGTKLVGFFDEAAKSFSKTDQQIQILNATVDAFNIVTNDSIGTTDSWNKSIVQLSDSLNLSANSLSKASQEIISVGSRLGFTEQQLQNLLTASATFAKIYKKDVFDVSVAVASALNGNAQAVQKLGIKLDESSVKAYAFKKGLGETFNSLTDNEKAQLRYNKLLGQYNDVAGIAGIAAGALADQTVRLELNLERLQTKLGEGARIIEDNSIIASALNVALDNVNDTVFKLAGFFGALGARILQIGGFFLEWSFKIFAVSKAIAILNALLASDFISSSFGKSIPLINKSLNDVLGNIGKTQIEIRSLSSLFTVLAKNSKLQMDILSRALFGASSASLTFSSAITGAFSKIRLALSGALNILKPFLLPLGKLVLIGALVVGAFKLISNAITEFDKRTGVVTETFNVLKDAFNESASFFQPLIGYFVKVRDVLVDLGQRAFGLVVSGIAFAFKGIAAIVQSNPFGVFSDETVMKFAAIERRIDGFNDKLIANGFILDEWSTGASRAIAGVKETAEATTLTLFTIFDGFTVGFNNSLMTSKEALENFNRQAAMIVQGGIVRSISGGIQNIIQSIAKGENAFENFGKFLLNIFGDLAIQLGTFFIAQGIAVQSLFAVNPPAAIIAAGAGLVALGSLLKAFGGSGGSSSSVGTGGGGSSPTEAGIGAGISTTRTDDLEERNVGRQVNITVQGSLVQQEELGLYLEEVLNDTRDKNGTVSTNVRTA